MWNNARTQPFDKAWEQLAKYIDSSSTQGKWAKGDRIFNMNARSSFLNIHLYFLKLFVCDYLDSGHLIETTEFANCLMNKRAHPDFYLRFFKSDEMSFPTSVEASEHIAEFEGTKLQYATWIYIAGRAEVMLIFNPSKKRTEGMRNAWHPKFGTTKIALFDL